MGKRPPGGRGLGAGGVSSANIPQGSFRTHVLPCHPLAIG